MAIPKFQQHLHALTESVYETALDAGGWRTVMQQMHALFNTSAETFYLLNPVTRRMREVHVTGITPRWVATFDEAYFSRDNPWMQLSDRLHQPGVVRTNERLIAYTRQREVLNRSQYYNEWMRPQDLHFTIGNTLLREPDLIANITLLRPQGMPTFSAAEVQAFEQLSTHMTRALRFSLKLEGLEVERTRVLQALAQLPQAALLIDPTGHVLQANLAAESLLRAQRGLMLCEGRLVAAAPEQQHRFAVWLAQGTQNTPPGDRAPELTLPAHRSAQAADGTSWTVQVLPLAPGRVHYRHAQAASLVLLTENRPTLPPSIAALRELFGLTQAEGRLAHALASGNTLRVAAGRLGIGYETARGCLKILFQKTATRRQSELVCRLRETAPRH
jgi:DNA-binding CsgD family transcriptional regulator/PAS domain-containing protein